MHGFLTGDPATEEQPATAAQAGNAKKRKYLHPPDRTARYN